MPLGVGRLTVSSPSSFCKFSELHALQAIFAQNPYQQPNRYVGNSSGDFSTLAILGCPSRSSRVASIRPKRRIEIQPTKNHWSAAKKEHFEAITDSGALRASHRHSSISNLFRRLARDVTSLKQLRNPGSGKLEKHQRSDGVLQKSVGRNLGDPVGRLKMSLEFRPLRTSGCLHEGCWLATGCQC